MGGAAGLPTSTVTAEENAAETPTVTEAAPAQVLEAYRPSLTTLQGFEGYQNPFRAAPGTMYQLYSPYQMYSPSQQQTAYPGATDLDAQYKAYTQGYAKNIQAAKDQRIASARAAEQSYQTAKANESLKAEYEQKLADQQAQFEQQQQQQQPYYNYVDIGASGGIASLQKGFKR